MSMRMIIHRILPLLLATAFLMAGCSRHSAEWQQLEIADAVMEEQPDSALSILTAIDPTSLINQEEKARYALLLTQALSKNYYVSSSDSLINIALDYYQEKGTLFEKTKTFFYVSEWAFYMDDYKKAIQFALKSNQVAQNLNDPLWLARTEELMGDIFSKSYNQEEWAKAAYKAAKLYDITGRKRNHDFLMVDYATALSNMGEINRGLYLMDSIYQASKKESIDSSLQAYCLRSIFPVLIKQNRDLEAIKYFFKLKEYDDFYSPSPKDYAIIAKAFLSENLDDEAYQMLFSTDSLDVSDNELAVLNSTKAEYYYKNKNYHNAYLYERGALEYQDKMVNKLLSQSISSVQKDFYNNLSLEEKNNAENIKNKFILYVIITLIVFCAILVIIHFKTKARKAELESKIQNIMLLSSELNEKNVINQNLELALKDNKHEIQNLKTQLDQQAATIKDMQELRPIAEKHSLMKKEMERLFQNSWLVLNTVLS